jgi:diketogulonate reductase-like aldo/keto reductase
MATISSIGLGTYQLRFDEAYAMTKQALEIGYRHIDTAALYRNEDAVGMAIKDSKIDRSEIFLTTKIHKRDIRNENIAPATLDSLHKLGTYIDLLLLHNVTDNFVQAWKTLQNIKESDERIREIGVSNFRIQELEQLDPKPKFNQIELTPFLQRRELARYCHKHMIRVIAHSPLTKGIKLFHPVLEEIAFNSPVEPVSTIRHSPANRSPAQILLSWCYQKGYYMVVRTSDPKHLEENFEIAELTNEEMAKLDALDCEFATHPRLL